MTSQIKVSKYFTYADLSVSTTAKQEGIPNKIPQELLVTAVQSARSMDAVREYLAKPVIPVSWYRSLALNTRIKGSKTSQHMKAEAIDFISPSFGSPVDICFSLREARSEILFDQLILEHSWVHISFALNPTRKPRGQVLTLLATGKYAVGLTNPKGVSY